MSLFAPDNGTYLWSQILIYNDEDRERERNMEIEMKMEIEIKMKHEITLKMKAMNHYHILMVCFQALSLLLLLLPFFCSCSCSWSWLCSQIKASAQSKPLLAKFRGGLWASTGRPPDMCLALLPSAFWSHSTHLRSSSTGGSKFSSELSEKRGGSWLDLCWSFYLW